MPSPPKYLIPTRNAAAIETAVCVAFLAITAIVRMPTLSRSVLDWDESLYFLMAEQWRLGHLPYTTIWDNKPIGIYAIFAIFQTIFGDRIAAMRIASIAVTGLTAFMVYKIIGRFGQNRQSCGSGLLGGGTYLLCSLSNDGLAANTELFMAAFSAGAVLAVSVPVVGRSGLSRAGLAGLLVGAAFMTKYVAVFEAPAILWMLLLRQRVSTGRCTIMPGALFTTGAVLPVAVVAAFYWHAGELPLWWTASIASNFLRVGTTTPPGALRYALHIELLRWGPLFLAGAALFAAGLCRLRDRRPLDGTDGVHFFLVIWLAGGCLGVAAAKSFYDHYFLQILPALCVILGWWSDRLGLFQRPATPARMIVVGLCIGAFLALPLNAAVVALRAAAAPIWVLHDGHFGLRPDPPAQIAKDLAAQCAVTPGGIYVFDSQPIIYSLAHQAPPTRYVFPSVLTTTFLAHVASVDAPAEVARILANRPLFVIRDIWPPGGQNALNRQVYEIVDAALATNYRLWRVYPGIAVYRLGEP